nr:9997_t:CDS:1 [Entrophospora candida]
MSSSMDNIGFGELRNILYDNKLQNLHSQNKMLEIDCKNLQTELNSKNKIIDDLIRSNVILKEEAIKYQSALDDATNFRLGVQDPNYADQLSKDIYNLHINLERLCSMRRVEINESEVKELLRKFGCSITGNIKMAKHLITGALERLVIETIIKKTNDYFELEENDKYGKQDDDKHDDEKQLQTLEMKVVKTTEQLLKLTDSISINRTGIDEVSKAASTKLRQQIYGSVLGNRGFSDIAIGKENKKHPLIATLQKDILDLMNRYRTIRNPEKLSKIESLNDEIVRQIVNIFFFQLKAQEPVAHWKFFMNKTSIDNTMMEGSWDITELEDLHVDICAFPMIVSNLCEADDKNLKVIFPAQIITGRNIKCDKGEVKYD